MADGEDILADHRDRIGHLVVVMSRRLRQLDAVQFVHQRAVVVLEADDFGVAAARRIDPHQPLQQPGAEGIEPLDAAHVDIDALELAGAPGLVLDLRLEAARVLRDPSAGAGELELLALGGSFQQRDAHSSQPLTNNPLISLSYHGLWAGKTTTILDPRP